MRIERKQLPTPSEAHTNLPILRFHGTDHGEVRAEVVYNVVEVQFAGAFGRSPQNVCDFIQFVLWCCKQRLPSTCINVSYDGFAGTLSSYRR